MGLWRQNFEVNDGECAAADDDGADGDYCIFDSNVALIDRVPGDDENETVWWHMAN